MTVNSFLQTASKRLEQADVGTARLDALVLLEDATGHDRSWLLAHPEISIETLLASLAKGPSLSSALTRTADDPKKDCEQVLSKKRVMRLQKQIERRARHEPLAYIRGKTEFYGREFYVDKRVLEPRSETETMIDLLKEIVASLQSSVVSRGNTSDWRLGTGDYIVDIGTGSGAIAVTVKLEMPEARVIGIDIEPDCLEVAHKNARKLKADIELLKGNLLEPLLTPHSSLLTPILLANLPYVPNGHQLNQAAMNEPKRAIFGGEDGLDLYRELFQQIEHLASRPQHILTESLPFQHKDLATIAKKYGYKLSKTDDFIQVFIP